MMEAVAILPFERFYGLHAAEVLRYLRRLLGARAEDAWQETFVRALRAYGRLEHGRHLRAWVFTIATNVAMDELRTRPSDKLSLGEIPAGGGLDGGELRLPAFRELEPLTGELPPTERAAVVLRYGYDLPYAEIGAALGSSEEAARAAASSGVRRLRRRLSAPTPGRAAKASLAMPPEAVPASPARPSQSARASVGNADQERSQ